jgi:hypothetical protein
MNHGRRSATSAFFNGLLGNKHLASSRPVRATSEAWRRVIAVPLADFFIVGI